MTSFTLYNKKITDCEFSVIWETFTPTGDGMVELSRDSKAIQKIKAGIYKDRDGYWPAVRKLTLEDARWVYRIHRSMGWLTAEEMETEKK
jgi:hypothetical protein